MYKHLKNSNPDTLQVIECGEYILSITATDGFVYINIHDLSLQRLLSDCHEYPVSAHIQHMLDSISKITSMVRIEYWTMFIAYGTRCETYSFSSAGGIYDPPVKWKSNIIVQDQRVYRVPVDIIPALSTRAGEVLMCKMFATMVVLQNVLPQDLIRIIILLQGEAFRALDYVSYCECEQ